MEAWNSPEIVAEPQVAAHDVLEQAHGLCLDELVDHVAENHANGVETLVSVADVSEARVVQKDLLNNEDSHCFGEFRTFIHDT